MVLEFRSNEEEIGVSYDKQQFDYCLPFFSPLVRELIENRITPRTGEILIVGEGDSACGYMITQINYHMDYILYLLSEDWDD
jgi:hypothetical protein